MGVLRDQGNQYLLLVHDFEIDICVEKLFQSTLLKFNLEYDEYKADFQIRINIKMYYTLKYQLSTAHCSLFHKSKRGRSAQLE